LFTPLELSEPEEALFQRLARLAPVKRVRSAERLADQAALFLHVRVAQLPEEARDRFARLYSNSVLAGKKVLIVDDDIRNIFAITSVLERQEMIVIPAETGQEAIERLQDSEGIDVVLMDIMMPGMDGYDTMREIRKIDRLRALPIIAVTAKAMKGDREKTLQAGAWDYLAKPVDTDQMLSVLRAWLLR
ncbi:MAG TPA: response regulator, partial [Thermoanaerobaculia bacterium]|nr:response regulator [Thermoanaerobaculia bacterium]